MGSKTKNKLVKCIVAPFKALGEARQFYMRAMFDCAQQVGQGGSVITFTVPHRIPQQLPKRKDSKKQMIEYSTSTSYSTGVGRLGRIDENKPCDFNELDINKVIYPRFTSYSAPSKT